MAAARCLEAHPEMAAARSMPSTCEGVLKTICLSFNEAVSTMMPVLPGSIVHSVLVGIRPADGTALDAARRTMKPFTAVDHVSSTLFASSLASSTQAHIQAQAQAHAQSQAQTQPQAQPQAEAQPQAQAQAETQGQLVLHSPPPQIAVPPPNTGLYAQQGEMPTSNSAVVAVPDLLSPSQVTPLES